MKRIAALLSAVGLSALVAARMRTNVTALLTGSYLLLAATLAAAEVCVTDDLDREVCLAAPAERIVALSPGITELLFAAGAGSRVVGTTSFSDYPPAAGDIPRIGSYKRLDLEALLAAEPDLVVAWISGNPGEQVERLETLGIPLFWSEQRNFDAIASSLVRYGRLAGTETVAEAAAAEFRRGVAELRARHADAAPVPVFYQIWEAPLMTVNGEHLISRAFDVCAARNIFAALPRLTPRIDVESVLDRDPEAILAGGMGEQNADWLDPWRAYPALRANATGNLFFVPPSSLQRPTPRILDGIRLICEHMETVRDRR